MYRTHGDGSIHDDETHNYRLNGFEFRAASIDVTVEGKAAFTHELQRRSPSFLWFLVSLLCARERGHASVKVLNGVVGFRCLGLCQAGHRQSQLTPQPERVGCAARNTPSHTLSVSSASYCVASIFLFKTPPKLNCFGKFCHPPSSTTLCPSMRSQCCLVLIAFGFINNSKVSAPSLLQPFMSPRYPGGPRPSLRMPNQVCQLLDHFLYLVNLKKLTSYARRPVS